MLRRLSRRAGASARHGVPESTYLLEMDGRPAFFGAYTLLIPELAEVARQFSEIDLVLPPINGFRFVRDSIARS
jgi:hypothetical protein